MTDNTEKVENESAENQTPTNDNSDATAASVSSSKKKVPTLENAKPDLTKADWGSYSKDYGYNQVVDFVSPFIVYQDGTQPKLSVAMLTAYNQNPEVFEIIQQKKIESDNERMKGEAVVRSQAYRQRKRDEDTQVLVDHIIKGWENVRVTAPKTWMDEAGEEHTEMVEVDVPYSRTACRNFLDSLTFEVFDDLRMFVTDVRYFIKKQEVDQETVQETVGN